jgi:2-methylaconitate cis-trans-isomerase PrpF
MTQTTILASGSTEATSSDVVLTSGAIASIGIFATTGSPTPTDRALLYIDSPGGDVVVSHLNQGNPVVQVMGPGTFRATRRVGSNCGVWSET